MHTGEFTEKSGLGREFLFPKKNGQLGTSNFLSKGKKKLFCYLSKTKKKFFLIKPEVKHFRYNQESTKI